MLKVKETATVVVNANKEAAKGAASIMAGNLVNTRLVKIVQPNLPLLMKHYVDTPLGKAVLANAAAAALIHTMPNNKKVVLAADAMIKAAMLEFTMSFNIEEKINELLDGISLDMLKDGSEEPQGVTNG